MAQEKTIEMSVDISAPAAKVWQALIDPQWTKKYMFGCEAISDWQIGSPVIWKGAADGVTYVIGNVVAFEPYSVIAYTVFDPNGTIENKPENHLTMSYKLSESNGITHLAISQGDFSTVENGEARYNDSLQGGDGLWQVVKQLVEQEG